MRALSKKRRLQQITANQLEYPEEYSTLDFPGKKELGRARRQRQQLLEQLGAGVEIGCQGTKLDMRGLSPGCRICVEGGWSCLFISGRCNCDCFYCPTDQTEFGLPTTNSVQFRHPADYVAYLERFGFSGASISGGEPLLTPGRSLGFLQAIKRHFGARMHVWLYTNGTLLTEDLVLQLRDAGLDEIRFDIGATAYQLQALKRASGVFPTLTVEIPAIPEEVGRLKALLGELRDAGVQHLNLHQLRLTPYNYPQLRSRGYRYLHGDKLTVLDSELAALEVLRFEREEKIGLPVNYCSFVYKNRFQARANRRHSAGFVLKGHEALSDNGYIRTLSLLGEKSRILQQQELFLRQGIAPALFSPGRSGEQLSFHPALWPLIDPGGLRLLVAYAGSRLLSGLSYHNPFVTVELSRRQKLIVERGRACPDFELDEQQAELFGQIFVLGFKTPLDLPNYALWDEIAAFEQPRSGMAEYF
jgi:pyruvate formate-lyase activating enzyme-like uncharacterized protein